MKVIALEKEVVTFRGGRRLSAAGGAGAGGKDVEMDKLRMQVCIVCICMYVGKKKWY